MVRSGTAGDTASFFSIRGSERKPWCNVLVHPAKPPLGNHMHELRKPA